MSQPSRLHLFQAYGIELEYMIVDKDSLMPKPIADELLKYELKEYGSDFENGMITWSNELVLHVIEIKSTRPEANFSALENEFAENVKRINANLEQWNAMLMPTAAHPLMNPLVDTKLWPHDNNEVYALYDKIFNSKGHGWSNLQSTHLNLPFYDDEEFAKLHAAIRIVLPILPALCASSPILDGKLTGKLNTRLEFYKTNQSKIPSITGRVIPEAIFSKRLYLNTIYEKIRTDVAPHDPEKILDPVWVNSRGAIPRFDRGSIEIRIMDIQECPSADLAIINLVIEFLKALVQEKFIPLDQQMKIKTETLVPIFDLCVEQGQSAIVYDPAYLEIFEVSNTITVNELWKVILKRLEQINISLSSWEKPEYETLLNQGNLSQRIIKALGRDTSEEKIKSVYRKLSGCLNQNKMFFL
ncbi:MAG TPA: glutamate--cysteine ligase [Cytophagales bacterium]|jgi:gamma-glutamyl:cysteine ligase YbdK (ATP-grasp superfamily)|nr:glutamate--cysteine ligase [Cytophagales bacterium]